MSILITLGIILYIFIAVVTLSTGLAMYAIERGGRAEDIRTAIRLIRYSLVWPLLCREFAKDLTADLRKHS